MTDGELVRQTLAGRLAAYAELAERWSARILAVCRSHLGRGDMAEDLAQESLVRALSALATLHDPEKFGPWLRGIAVRACLDWRKSKQAGQVSFSALDTPIGRFDPAGNGSDVDDEVQLREDCERLRIAVEELPEAYRETLLLYYCQRVTYQELAELLGISRATINLRLTKARAMLREKLREKLRVEKLRAGGIVASESREA
jgi:RNA polymerase sigma-70 factor (ECF subfamily)